MIGRSRSVTFAEPQASKAPWGGEGCLLQRGVMEAMPRRGMMSSPGTYCGRSVDDPPNYRLEV